MIGVRQTNSFSRHRHNSNRKLRQWLNVRSPFIEILIKGAGRTSGDSSVTRTMACADLHSSNSIQIPVMVPEATVNEDERPVPVTMQDRAILHPADMAMWECSIARARVGFVMAAVAPICDGNRKSVRWRLVWLSARAG
jgi:hypothetical protein